MITLTDKASDKVKEIQSAEGLHGQGLRLRVIGGGCSGFSYVLEFADDPPRSRDLVFEYPVERKPDDAEDPGVVRVFCDKKSILYLNDSTLDWEKTLKYQGFKFVNPQVKSSCGCNESFAV